ncbi:MAG: response regulator transcription factor [Acetobacteraceae bacterium]|nr:response regulator transcription factor [Acetobacteraceae bacterium]
MNAIASSREVVLVVDDSPATLGLLSEALERAGYTVLVAQSGNDALELMQRISPDIVLMDAVMPGLDGFETTRLMKANPTTSSIPVVFMTGLTETEHVVRGLESGGVDYVAKPVAPDEVVARVTVHLATARLARSAQLALDTTGRYLLAVTRSGHVLWSTPQATRLLQFEAAETAMPQSVVTWLQDCIRAGAPATEKTLLLDLSPTRRVRITLLGEVSQNEILLRLTPSVTEEALLTGNLNITSREAEVLLWLSRGKTNRDIAAILELSPRTVNKHLEQIFTKLQVDNRASATAVAVRILGTI